MPAARRLLVHEHQGHEPTVLMERHSGVRHDADFTVSCRDTNGAAVLGDIIDDEWQIALQKADSVGAEI